MIPLNCAEVQDQLDLLAAGACEPADRLEIERHLRDCPQCAARHAESQRLLGLLDLHWSQAALERVQRRIEQQARPQPKRRFVTSFVRGYVAAAAVLLIAVGVTWWNVQDTPAGPQLALLVHAGRQSVKLESEAPTRALPKGVEAPAPALAISEVQLRQRLLQAARDGKLPPPPAIDLDLTLVNNGKRPVTIRIGATAPTLALEVQGNGVLRIPVPAAQTPSFLEPQTLRLEAGQQHVIHIDRLVAGWPGAVEYVYLTEPGEYTVTARLRLTADGVLVTVLGGPVRIMVSHGN